jgi:hypothetical protein
VGERASHSCLVIQYGGGTAYITKRSTYSQYTLLHVLVHSLMCPELHEHAPQGARGDDDPSRQEVNLSDILISHHNVINI